MLAKKTYTDMDCGIVSEKGLIFKEKIIPEGYGFGVAVLVGYAANDGGTPHEINMSKIKYV